MVITRDEVYKLSDGPRSALLQILNILEISILKKHGVYSANYIHTIYQSYEVWRLQIVTLIILTGI